MVEMTKCIRDMRVGGKWKRLRDGGNWLSKKQRRSWRKKQRRTLLHCILNLCKPTASMFFWYGTAATNFMLCMSTHLRQPIWPHASCRKRVSCRQSAWIVGVPVKLEPFCSAGCCDPTESPYNNHHQFLIQKKFLHMLHHYQRWPV